ncbi:MAG TPA: class I SAM-dependent methyltransferase [Vicinamibacterales bacterium]|nr:class I SAM-dependent methyltransferase [Vicinamibacterales bacterium]
MKPVSRTAFYCTGVRALDAGRPQPACGDQYAGRFMGEDAWRAFEPFRHFTGPNASNATRHRIIDDLLRERLSADRERRIILIGAGFDSRAFRLSGGRWLEVDEPQVFAWKEPRLPAAESPNPLIRLAVDFAAERLADRLAPFADPDPVTIVIEGVLFYLGEARIRELLRTLRAIYPQGEIIGDVMTLAFFRAFGQPIHRKIVELGASFELPARDLADVFAGEGYTQTGQHSTTQRAAELGLLPWYMRLMLRISRRFVDGYAVRVFEPS